MEIERLRDKVEEARAALRLAELEEEAMTVRAPLSGRVTRVHVALGQSVEKGVPLIELEADQGIGVTFALPPDRASQVQPALPFALADDKTTRTYKGSIITVGAGVVPTAAWSASRDCSIMKAFSSLPWRNHAGRDHHGPYAARSDRPLERAQQDRRGRVCSQDRG